MGATFWMNSYMITEETSIETFPSMTGVPLAQDDDNLCQSASLTSSNSSLLAVSAADCNGLQAAVCRRYSNIMTDQFCQSVSTLEFLLDPANKLKRDKAIDKKSKSTKRLFQKWDHARSYKSLFSSLWYSSLPCFDVRNISAQKDGERSMLKYCEWQGKQVPCSAVFTSVPTDRGMCCSFNAKAAEELFSNGPYQVTFRMNLRCRVS